jgi:hypothetical protein
MLSENATTEGELETQVAAALVAALRVSPVGCEVGSSLTEADRGEDSLVEKACASDPADIGDSLSGRGLVSFEAAATITGGGGGLASVSLISPSSRIWSSSPSGAAGVETIVVVGDAFVVAGVITEAVVLATSTTIDADGGGSSSPWP